MDSEHEDTIQPRPVDLTDLSWRITYFYDAISDTSWLPSDAPVLRAVASFGRGIVPVLQAAYDELTAQIRAFEEACIDPDNGTPNPYFALALAARSFCADHTRSAIGDWMKHFATPAVRAELGQLTPSERFLIGQSWVANLDFQTSQTVCEVADLVRECAKRAGMNSDEVIQELGSIKAASEQMFSNVRRRIRATAPAHQ